MTRGEVLIETGKCKSKHCSPMSNAACCDLNSGGNILNYMILVIIQDVNVRKNLLLLENIFNSKELVQKILRKKYSTGLKNCEIFSLNQDWILSASVVAKTKNPEAGEVTSDILKSLTGERVLKSNKPSW